MLMRAQLPVGTLALVAALVSISACDVEFGDMGRFSRDFHYTFPLQAHGRIAVETFNGSVEISGWDQQTVDISGTKYGPTEETAEALTISVDHTPDSVSVRAVRPADRRGNQGARFVIKIPRDANLERIASANGSIRTIDGAGPARLRTSNGSIHVEASRMAAWMPRPQRRRGVDGRGWRRHRASPPMATYGPSACAARSREPPATAASTRLWTPPPAPSAWKPTMAASICGSRPKFSSDMRAHHFQ